VAAFKFNPPENFHFFHNLNKKKNADGITPERQTKDENQVTKKIK